MKAKAYVLSLAACFVLSVVSIRGQSTTGEIPPGVSFKRQPDGVVRFDRAVGSQPSYWQLLLDLFQWKPTKAPPFGRSVAFVVGVSQYKNLRPQLPFVESDLTELRNYLLTDGGFDTVFEVRNGDVRRSLIEDYMVNKFSRDTDDLTRNDRFLFYYSGHGADQEGHFGYLQFSDAKANNFAGDQVLPVREFNDWAQLNVAKHMLIVLDSCASGLAVRVLGEASQEALLRSLSGEGSGFLLTAGTGDQAAWQVELNNRNGFSVFTRALLNTLRDGTADQDNSGLVTINEVFGHAEKYVGEFEAESGRKMNPQIWPLSRANGPAKGTFVFLNTKARHPRIAPRYNDVLTVSKAAGPAPEAKTSTIGTENDPGMATDSIDRDGENYYYGRGAKQDFERAGQSFQQASDLGSPRAKAFLGLMYEQGIGAFARDEHKALEFCQDATKREEPLGFSCLGFLYLEGRGGLLRDEAKARQLFQKAESKSEPLGMVGLGALYLEGRGDLSRNENKAAELFRRAADQGDFSAMAFLAHMYAEGLGGVFKDKLKALELLQISAQHNDLYGIVGLADMYDDGAGSLQKDQTKAFSLCTAAAKRGSSAGIACLGVIYLQGRKGLGPDEHKAAELLTAAMELGNTRGTAALGAMYLDGVGGLPKNASKGIDLLQTSAERGNLGAVAILGSLYLYGRAGLPRDEAKAVQLLREASDHEIPLAMAFLGLAYLVGAGVPEDEEKGVNLLQRTADLEDPTGMALLGIAYELSENPLIKSSTKAVQMFRASADLGSPLGIYFLGLAYEYGKGGLSKDKHKAEQLYKKAAQNGLDLDTQREFRNLYK